MSDCPVKCSSTVSVIAAFQQNTMEPLNMPQLFQEYLEMAGFRGNSERNPTPTPTPNIFVKLNWFIVSLFIDQFLHLWRDKPWKMPNAFALFHRWKRATCLNWMEKHSRNGRDWLWHRTWKHVSWSKQTRAMSSSTNMLSAFCTHHPRDFQ